MITVNFKVASALRLRTIAICSIVTSGAFSYTAIAAKADELDNFLKAEQPRVIVSARVRIAFTTPLDSGECHEGDPVEADLKEDIKHREEVLIPAGSKFHGHIKSFEASRKLARSMVTKNQRFRRHASISIVFDELITPQQEHFEITAKPAPQVSMFNYDRKTRLLRVAADGAVTKTENVDLMQLPEIDLAVSSSLLDPRRFDVRIRHGDELKVDADVPIDSRSVSSKVMKK